MAKKMIQNQGAKIDQTKNKILDVIVACKKQEKALTRAGAQAGNIHFKSDRNNTMYVLEPTNSTGKRKYVSVGVNRKKQADMQTKVDRWQQRDSLQRTITQLECELELFDFQFNEVEHVILRVKRQADKAQKNYLPK